MNLNKINLLGFSTLLFISCSKQPSCMEEETLKTANDLARNIIMTDIAYEKYITDMRFDPAEQEISKVYINARLRGKSVDEVLLEIKNNMQSYINENKTDSIPTKKYIDYAKENIDKLELKLINIKTSAKEDEIKKCDCEAQIKTKDGVTRNVIYSSQINEQGENIVELEIYD